MTDRDLLAEAQAAHDRGTAAGHYHGPADAALLRARRADRRATFLIGFFAGAAAVLAAVLVGLATGGAT